MNVTRNRAGLYCFSEPATADQILAVAETILAERFYRDDIIANPDGAANYIRSRIALRPSEVFCCVYLDQRHRVIAFEELFYGTIDSAEVHPRDVVRACLKHNAAAVLLAHNHPSGYAEPSQADIAITRRLREALALIDVRVLDHFIIGGTTITSMATRGLV
jgi:DNA repair protein RadC